MARRRKKPKMDAPTRAPSGGGGPEPTLAPTQKTPAPTADPCITYTAIGTIYEGVLVPLQDESGKNVTVLPKGKYEIKYVDGCMMWDVQLGYSIHYNGVWRLVLTDGSGNLLSELPGNMMVDDVPPYDDQATCEAANLAESTPITFDQTADGPAYVANWDGPFFDNGNGDPNPTWTLRDVAKCV